MSRKVLPRWGEIGVTKVPIFTVSNEQFADLCTQLGLTKSDIPPQLKARLERIATRYRLWVQQDEKGPSQAERNAALKQVLASPQDLELRLAQLDFTTEGERSMCCGCTPASSLEAVCRSLIRLPPMIPSL
jgi:hypothetical protein